MQLNTHLPQSEAVNCDTEESKFISVTTKGKTMPYTNQVFINQVFPNQAPLLN